MAVPYSFATQTGSIPLSQLDSNFATSITLGNTAVVLGNTYSTIGNLTLSNVTISSGNVSINVSNVSTINTVTLTVTGNETVGGNVTITGNVSVNVANVTTLNATSSTITGNETVGGNVTVTGNVSVNNATFSNSLTLSGGTANAVAYLNVSKVLTTGSALTFDGTNLGLGVTPSAWGSSFKSIELGAKGVGIASNPSVYNTILSSNAYQNGTGWTYGNSSYASQYQIGNSGTHSWYIAPSGTAGNAITFTQAMTLDTNGMLVLGGTSALQPGGSPSTRGEVSINGSTDSFVSFGIGGTLKGYIGQTSTGLQLDTEGSTTITFVTNGTERMRIDSSGNVGIGTSSPLTKLDVIGTIRAGTTSNQALNAGWSSGASQVFIQGYDSGTALYVDTALRGGTVQFFTGTSSNTERARIDTSGNFFIGTTASNVSSGGFAFIPQSGVGTVNIGHITGTASGSTYQQFLYNGTVIGSITQNGTTGVLYNITSDQRLKENIVDAPSASDDIDAIQVRSFDFISDKSPVKYGFIAQELVKVVPEAVHQPINQEEMMGVDYSKLVPMMLKEIQSLRARLKAANIA
jgi:Chaperone of endosialidase